MKTNPSKIFNDPIHGHVEVPHHCIKIIDTPQYQRLRDLKQLGVTYLTYTGASHNRFEHCLGVSHLAKEFMAKLQREQPELEIEDRDVKNVQVAGLIHDLGHGPFSHCFEKWIHNYKPDLPFHHEDMSKKMFRHLIDDNGIDLFQSEDIEFIEELVTGTCSKKYEPKSFMYEIVANKRNSVDVDKFDYLARDCYFCNVGSTFHSSRLIIFSRVINNEVCYHSKEATNINNLFNTRFTLFKQVYLHKVGTALEHMISDAFTAADPVINIAQKAMQPETYTYLTDSILKSIEGSSESSLASARDIIKRIRKRDLYKLVDEYFIPNEINDKWKIPKAAEIVSCQSHDSSIQLEEKDIIVDTLINNYALNDKNPIESIHWYNKHDQTTSSFSLKQDQISELAPKVFIERFLRIYCRNPAKVKIAQQAWINYLRINKGEIRNSPMHGIRSPISNSSSSQQLSSSDGVIIKKKLFFVENNQY